MKIQADKNLGQHFLINQGVIERIAETVWRLSEQGKHDVIEVGPGPGALTGMLLKKGLRVLALEVDRRMIAVLEQSFAEAIASGKLKLVHADALRLDFAELLHAQQSPERVICGNLPYNVGTAIVFRFLEEFPAARSFCYMLQKEVVERLIADVDTRDYGPARVKLAWCAQILGNFWVKPGSFSPPPKVDSGVFWFERLPPEKRLADPCKRGEDYDRAARFVSQVFSQRRKMLRSSCRALAQNPWAAHRPENVPAAELFGLGLLVATSAGKES